MPQVTEKARKKPGRPRKERPRELTGLPIGRAVEEGERPAITSAQGHESLARARERVSDAALADWTSRIQGGATDHTAAALSREALGHVWSVEQLREACRNRPLFQGALEKARNLRILPLEKVVKDIAEGRIKDGSIARAQLQAATWLLARLRPLEYGEHARVEHTGAGGAPIRTEVVMVLADARALARTENAE